MGVSTVVRARAKLNFVLSVGRKIGDRHEIDTVIVPFGLYDEVSLCARSDGRVTVSYDGVFDRYPVDPAKKLAEKIVKTYRLPGVDVAVKKRIPEGAGLGGSSADAGAVARGMERLFHYGETARSLLAEAGSDVVAAYLDRPCRVRGTGEIAEPLDGLILPSILVLGADGGVSTAACYRKFDEVGGERADVEKTIEAMKKGENFLPVNALTRAAELLRPEIARSLDALRKLGFPCGMTGSGSAIFAFGYQKDNFLKKAASFECEGRTVLFLE